MALGGALWTSLPPWEGFSVAYVFLDFGLAILGAGLVRDLALKAMELLGRLPSPPPAPGMCLCLESILGLSFVTVGLVFLVAGTSAFAAPGGMVLLLVGAGVLVSGLVAPFVVSVSRDAAHQLPGTVAC
jgi:hypothetical protein